MTKTWQTRRTGFFFGLGLAIWVVATLALHLAAKFIFLPGNTGLLALIFLLSGPLMWGLVRLIARLGQVAGTALLAGTSVVGFVGLLLDGLLVAFFPGVYGVSTEALVLLGGWLMWAYALCWMFAFYSSIRS